LALWYLDPLTWPWRLLLAGVWAAAVFAFARHRRPFWRAPLVAIAGVAAVLIRGSLREPRLAAAPSPDQARAPHADVVGSIVTLNNVRNARYRSATDYDVAWETRTFDLADLTTVDFIVEPFEALRAVAHTFISFGFKDDQHLALSFETEHLPGRPYGPVRGLFRQYVLRAVAGDERDLIGLRTEIRRDDVYVYPLRSNQKILRRLFLLLMQRVNALEARPEYYNTLTNNCTTQYRTVYETLTQRSLRFDPRVYLPGYADALALHLGLIEWTGSVGEARRHFRVNGRAPLDDLAYRDGRGWSRRLRIDSD
jgi:hypothetical protein